MKKYIMLVLLLALLCGCSKKVKTECIYNNEKDESMKSYMRVTLISNNDVVEKEELYAVYKFKDSDSASSNYEKIESVLKQDSSVKLEQIDESIIAKGEKDVTSMQYDKEAKILYYEQLGYTCE